MMSRTRARVKPEEYRPEWVNCCDRNKAKLSELGEFLVDLTDTYTGRGWCLACGHDQGHRTSVTAFIDGHRWWIGLDLLDLDEGPETTT